MQKTRREFLKALGVAGLAAAASRLTARAADAPAAKPAAGKPNIIFILTDDQGWGDAKRFGHPYLKTPNIDRLADGGAWFKQFYVANPVCSPSRTAFMTGHYPARHGVHQHFADHASNLKRGMPNWLDPDVTTVCDLVKSAGYATAHFGKWHLGHGEGAPAPEAYGIDASRTWNSSGAAWPQQKTDPYFVAHSADLVVDEAIAFIKQHRDKPFYVNVWSYAPHATLKPTPEELAVYDDLKVDPKDFPAWMRDYVAGAKDPVQQMKVFCAAVTGLDKAIGRLLDFLDETGLAKDTIVFFSSDNGPEDYHIGNASNAGMGSPGVLRARKRSLYEGGIRTPLLVRWPGHVKAGRVDETSVLASVDFLPTVCGIVGVDAGKCKPDGEDVGNILTGKARPRTRPIFWEWRSGVVGNPQYTPPRLAVREGNWKLYVNYDGSGKQLYDVVADASQEHDVAKDHAELVSQLAEKVLAWKKTLPP